jgi:nucleoside 2-deoxyribosyltransferase
MMQQGRELRAQLQQTGHVVTSRWLDNEEESKDKAAAAQMDLDDVDSADALVLLGLPKGTTYKGGGRMVEFGYAVAKGKKLFLVTDRECVFGWLPQVTFCSTTQEFLLTIRGA